MTKIKIGVSGPSGSGKTMSSLLLAFGLVKGAHPDWTDTQCWDKVCVVDTENGSASMYVNYASGNTRIGEYYTITLAPPFEAEKFIDSIHACEESGMEAVIVDSLSHYWAGTGGALDKQGKIAARTGNSYTAWRDVTPEYNDVMNAILQSTCHVICSLRAKTEYTQEKGSNGKTVVRNLGMGSQIREGNEYEYGIFFSIDNDHIANATKDRTGIFDGKYFTITPETGKEIVRWLSTAAPIEKTEPAPKPVKAAIPAENPVPPANAETVTMEMVDNVVKGRCAGATAEEKKAVADEIRVIAGVANYKNITDPGILKAIYDHFKKGDEA